MCGQAVFLRSQCPVLHPYNSTSKELCAELCHLDFWNKSAVLYLIMKDSWEVKCFVFRKLKCWTLFQSHRGIAMITTKQSRVNIPRAGWVNSAHWGEPSDRLSHRVLISEPSVLVESFRKIGLGMLSPVGIVLEVGACGSDFFDPKRLCKSQAPWWLSVIRTVDRIGCLYVVIAGRDRQILRYWWPASY